MTRLKYILLVSLLILSQLALLSQITVVNPSFEDQPADATIPKGWLYCQEGTTPDILPGFWGEYGEPSDGETYIGMITRENGTYESITQKTSRIMAAGQGHAFTIDLAKGAIYTGYNRPIKLRVWIGDEKCDKDQLIYESPFIKNEEWETHQIKFIPEENSQYIILEAFYQEGPFNYKGNILIDAMSTIFITGRV